MSKADVECPYCDYEWTYSGLGCKTCYCPSCSGEVRLDGPNADIIEHFGFASNNTSAFGSEAADTSKPVHYEVDDDKEDSYETGVGEDMGVLDEF